MTDQRPLWERQPWDTEASFDRFQRFYLPQKAPRSVNEAYRLYRKEQGRDEAEIRPIANGCWRAWSEGKTARGKEQPGAVSWADRARAYDDYLAAQERATFEEEWTRRRSQLIEQEWKSAQALIEKATGMLQFPLQRVYTTEVYEDGRTKQITVEPANWNLRDAERLLKTASELARLAANMTQGIVTHTGDMPVAVYLIQPPQPPEPNDDDDTSG